LIGAELTSSLHVFQPPCYQASGGRWHAQFGDAVADASGPLTWDATALRSIVAFGFASSDRTLWQQISRRPWLSEVSDYQLPRLEIPPEHGLRFYTAQELVRELHRRLRDEAGQVCRGRKAIYLTLSGGLDSRIVAGVVAELRLAGELDCRPVAVTWGAERSRDVVYGREIARLLDFEWVHVPLGAEDVWDNVSAAAEYLGALVPPSDLHRFLWFKDVERDALVLGGTYGDSVGRGEFSGRTLLELRPMKPGDPLGLLRPEIAAAADLQWQADVEALRSRCSEPWDFVRFEHEQFAFYLRGMVAHAMSMIGQFCDLYQMFTDPAVYGFMWSVHPSLRTNAVYYGLLDALGNGLAQVPWARTNRAVVGKTRGRDRQASRVYHHASDWISGPLYDRLRTLVDPAWFDSTGVFDGEAIARLGRVVRNRDEISGAPGVYLPKTFAWLAAVRLLGDRIDVSGRLARHVAVADQLAVATGNVPRSTIPDGRIRRVLRKMPDVRRWLKTWNANRLRRQFLRDYPARTH
jgi:asparagine synthase (glutamine-hydrolysing)